MAKICDRSLCDKLLVALGVWLFGSPDNDGFYITISVAGEEKELDIEYCPFCGTRIEEVDKAVIEKYFRPRRRRRRNSAPPAEG